MSIITQMYFQIVEENNYTFWPFSGLAIIRLRLGYQRKLIHYNVDIKNGGMRSRFTMSGEVCNYIYAMWNLRWLQCTVQYCTHNTELNKPTTTDNTTIAGINCKEQ
jgi:hypothetical protein